MGLPRFWLFLSLDTYACRNGTSALSTSSSSL